MPPAAKQIIVGPQEASLGPTHPARSHGVALRGRRRARLAGDPSQAPPRVERARPAARSGRAEPPAVGAVLPPGAVLHPLGLAPARPHRRAGGALHDAVPRRPGGTAGARAGRGGGGESGRSMLQVAAAEGVLAPLARRAIGSDDAGLVARSLTSDRLELVRDPSGAPTTLVAGLAVGSAAAVPLRAHGALVGTLVIADPRDGAFPPEDVRLLSTVATHAAIVIANARFFEHVRHAKEQWETAFDSLSEGIAVVNEAGRAGRAHTAPAAGPAGPVPGRIGGGLGGGPVGPAPP